MQSAIGNNLQKNTELKTQNTECITQLAAAGAVGSSRSSWQQPAKKPMNSKHRTLNAVGSGRSSWQLAIDCKKTLNSKRKTQNA